MPIIGRFAASVIESLSRFPLAIAACVVFYVLSNTTDKVWFPPESRQVWLTICSCGALWFVIARLAAEAYKIKSPLAHGLALAGFAGIVAVAKVASPQSVPCLFLSAGLSLLLLVAPVLRRESSDSAFWTFAVKVCLRTVFAYFAASLLFLGAVAVFTSIDFLFDTHVMRGVVADMARLCFALVAPLLAIGGIPSHFTETAAKGPSAAKLLLANILVPLLVIYSTVLYAYIARIAVQGSLPKGGVAYNVMGFGIVGILLCLLSYPWRLEKGFLFSFARYFFWALPLPLILMGIGLSTRIQAYGVSEGRYAVALSLLWLAAITAHTLWSRGQIAMRGIVAGAALLLILASFGPWGASAVAENSQFGRLQSILTRNHMLQDGRLVKPADVVLPADVAEISALVDFFIQTKRPEALEPLFTGSPEASIFSFGRKDLTIKDRLQAPQKIVADMGLTYLSIIERKTSPERKAAMAKDFQYRQVGDPVVVTGYDYLFSFNSWQPKTDLAMGQEHLEVKYDKGIYRVSLPGGQPITFDLADLAARKKADNALPLSLEKEENGLRIKMLMNHMVGKEGDNPMAPPQISSADGFFLVKKLTP